MTIISMLRATPRPASRGGVLHRACRPFCRPSRSLSSTVTATVKEETSSSPQSQHPKYPHLFTPLDLGPCGILPNRVLMGSMHTGLEGHSIPGVVEKFVLNSSAHDHSLDRMATYFQERAQGGVGLMVTGGIAPNKAGWVGPFAAKLTTQDEMRAHQVVTEAVHSVNIPIYGSGETVTPKICLQILHTGRYAYHPFCVSASNTKSPISPYKAKALTKSGIHKTVQDFAHTASLAQQAGYDGVEIMGSEGYLLSQFLCPRTNFRTDDYGGSLQNRMRFPLDIVQQVRQACGPNFLIIFRISLLDLVEGGMSLEESLDLAVHLEQAGVSILNTGIGWHEARVPTIATCVPRGAFGFPTKTLKQSNLVNIPIVSTNRINMPSVAEDLLSDGTSDLVSMVRQYKE